MKYATRDKGKINTIYNLTPGFAVYNETQRVKDLFWIEKTLDLLYGENWNFLLSDATSHFIQGVRLFFPETIISNSLGETHTITKSFIDILFTEEHYALHKIAFFRGEYSSIEWEKEYMHSHVQKNMFKDLSESNGRSFCFGKAPESRLKVLEMSLRESFNREHLGEFFFLLNTFMSHESISGVPYISISSLTSEIASTIPDVIATEYSLSEESKKEEVEKSAKSIFKELSKNGLENTDIQIFLDGGYIQIDRESVKKVVGKAIKLCSCLSTKEEKSTIYKAGIVEKLKSIVNEGTVMYAKTDGRYMFNEEVREVIIRNEINIPKFFVPIEVKEKVLEIINEKIKEYYESTKQIVVETWG